MKVFPRAATILLIALASLAGAASLAPAARAENALSVNAAPDGPGHEDALIRQMVGTWAVQQRMWPGSGADPIQLPPAVARRRLIGGAFLEEVMELAPESRLEPFTRVAYFNYNAVNQQYEYFSMDTRGPQMMNERSYDAGLQAEPHGERAIKLYGDSFVAPRWGDARNVAFRYRLDVGEVKANRQVVRLHLTPLSAASAKEFLAVEYVYTRRR